MPHGHSHAGVGGSRHLGVSIVLTLAFVLGEAVAGYLAHSLALLSDAGHNLADALALVLTWYTLRMARWPADARQTFGYHRAGILAALVNAVTLVVIALSIFWEGAHRLQSPEPVQGGPMIAVALVAVVLNGVISLGLRGDAGHDLNVRSAYLHMLGDMVSAAGVVAAGVVVSLTGSRAADPVVSMLIGVLILWSSWGILAESVNVLMEGVPKGLDMAALERSLRDVPGVLGVHHLHVWTLASGRVACSCHVVVNDQSVRSGQRVLRAVSETLTGRYGVAHTTVQVEVEGCEPDAMYCFPNQADRSCPGHRH